MKPVLVKCPQCSKVTRVEKETIDVTTTELIFGMEGSHEYTAPLAAENGMDFSYRTICCGAPLRFADGGEELVVGNADDLAMYLVKHSLELTPAQEVIFERLVELQDVFTRSLTTLFILTLGESGE